MRFCTTVTAFAWPVRCHEDASMQGRGVTRELLHAPAADAIGTLALVLAA
jgi:hypothetical protein